MTISIQRSITALDAVYDIINGVLTEQPTKKVRNIIDLYSDRKIDQFTTADNLIRKFITARTPKDKEKAENEYKKVYDKHKDKPSLGERMQEAKQENQRSGRTIPTKKYAYCVPVMFYKYRTMLDHVKRTFFMTERGILWYLYSLCLEQLIYKHLDILKTS